MGMGFAPTWLRQVSPPPAPQNHFNHWWLFNSPLTGGGAHFGGPTITAP